MKTPFNKATLSILATLASIGAAHAESGKIMIPAGAANQAIVEQLVRSGHIIPLDELNWYQIDQDRLNAALQQSDAGDGFAQDTIKNMKAIVGDRVDIKSVLLFESHPGGQDSGAE